VPQILTGPRPLTGAEREAADLYGGGVQVTDIVRHTGLTPAQIAAAVDLRIRHLNAHTASNLATVSARSAAAVPAERLPPRSGPTAAELATYRTRVRQWARGEGLRVPRAGIIPAPVMAAYRAAHPYEADPGAAL